MHFIGVEIITKTILNVGKKSSFTNRSDRVNDSYFTSIFQLLVYIIQEKSPGN